MAAEKPSSDARKARLARALKANIARRKAQARALAGSGATSAASARPAGEGTPDVPPDEDGCPN